MRRENVARLLPVAAILLTLMIPGIGRAELNHGKVEVLGMTCEFCEKALEKNLQKIQGVDQAKADLVKGFAEFTFKKEAILDVDQIATKVRDAGLTLKQIHLVATGQVVDRQSRKASKVSGTDQLLFLDGSQAALPESGEVVTVTGEVEQTSDGKAIILAVREVTRGGRR